MFGSKEKRENRFVNILTEYKDSVSMMVYVDAETGVQYLFGWAGGEAGGMTILVDQDGKPLLHKDFRPE